jgi:hypothetical protein
MVSSLSDKQPSCQFHINCCETAPENTEMVEASIRLHGSTSSFINFTLFNLNLSKKSVTCREQSSTNLHTQYLLYLFNIRLSLHDFQAISGPLQSTLHTLCSRLRHTLSASQPSCLSHISSRVGVKSSRLIITP